MFPVSLGLGAEGVARPCPCQRDGQGWPGEEPAAWAPRSHGTQWSYHRGTHVCPPLQAKDSDDDDDVTVTVDRDHFMDEFFEQVGAAPPPLPKHRQTWGGHVSPLSRAQGSHIPAPGLSSPWALSSEPILRVNRLRFSRDQNWGLPTPSHPHPSLEESLDQHCPPPSPHTHP